VVGKSECNMEVPGLHRRRNNANAQQA